MVSLLETATRPISRLMFKLTLEVDHFSYTLVKGLIILAYGVRSGQGTLTEGEGSVKLTSLH
jgi:hypothetical protein